VAEASAVRVGDALVYRSYRDAVRIISSSARLRFRFSHQPNAFASFAVLSIPAFAWALARRNNSSIDCSASWVLVDYDSADDQQLLRLRMPKALPDHQTRMSGLVPRRSTHRRLASSVPSSAAVARLPVLKTELTQSALALRHYLASREIKTNSRKECRRQAEDSIARLDADLAANRRLTDALGQHNRWEAKTAFGIDVRIVSGTDWLLGQATARLRALTTVVARHPKLVDGGTWRVCPRCYTRTRVPIHRDASGNLATPDTQCREGHSLAAATLDFARTIESIAGPCPAFILPVRLDDVMERLVADDCDLIVSYPGSYAHLRESVRAVHTLRAVLDRSKRGIIPDWCPSHRVQNLFHDLIRSRLLPDDQQIPVASSLYRSSLAVARSIFPQDLGATIGKHVERTLKAETED
jgi:hypothetical protein